MGVKCDIELDKQTYFPGETVKVNVTLEFEAAKKIKGISVRFKGDCGTKWTRGAGKSTITYSADEEYFRTYHYIVGEKDGHEIEYPAGIQKYPVQFTLPKNIPSTFGGRNGHVRYSVKVNIDVSWNFDTNFVAEFNVISPIDLNQMPQVQAPLRVEQIKQFTCCCIPVGGLYNIVIDLPCTGFSNEEKIPLTVECTNGSNVYVRGLKVALRKLITYHAKSPHSETKRDDVKLSVLKFEINVDKQQKKQFTGELAIPAKTAVNVAHCNMIEVSHRLEVITILSGCRSPFVFDIPISIGHRPIIMNNHHPSTIYPNGRSSHPPSYEMAMLTSVPAN